MPRSRGQRALGTGPTLLHRARVTPLHLLHLHFHGPAGVGELPASPGEELGNDPGLGQAVRLRGWVLPKGPSSGLRSSAQPCPCSKSLGPGTGLTEALGSTWASPREAAALLPGVGGIFIFAKGAARKIPPEVTGYQVWTVRRPGVTVEEGPVVSLSPSAVPPPNGPNGARTLTLS